MELPEVKLGDLWAVVDDANPEAKGTYIVIESNDNTEAGPDSWKMQRVSPGSGRYPQGKILYMHHRAREAGAWELVSKAIPKRAVLPQQKHNLLVKLENFWLQHPQLRLGQLVHFLASTKDTFYVEDQDLSEALDQISVVVPEKSPIE